MLFFHQNHFCLALSRMCDRELTLNLSLFLSLSVCLPFYLSLSSLPLSVAQPQRKDRSTRNIEKKRKAAPAKFRSKKVSGRKIISFPVYWIFWAGISRQPRHTSVRSSLSPCRLMHFSLSLSLDVAKWKVNKTWLSNCFPSPDAGKRKYLPNRWETKILLSTLQAAGKSLKYICVQRAWKPRMARMNEWMKSQKKIRWRRPHSNIIQLERKSVCLSVSSMSTASEIDYESTRTHKCGAYAV